MPPMPPLPPMPSCLPMTLCPYDPLCLHYAPYRPMSPMSLYPLCSPMPLYLPIPLFHLPIPSYGPMLTMPSMHLLAQASTTANLDSLSHLHKILISVPTAICLHYAPMPPHVPYTPYIPMSPVPPYSAIPPSCPLCHLPITSYVPHAAYATLCTYWLRLPTTADVVHYLNSLSHLNP